MNYSVCIEGRRSTGSARVETRSRVLVSCQPCIDAANEMNVSKESWNKNNLLEVDGQKWDVSNLRLSPSSMKQYERLYPKVTDDYTNDEERSHGKKHGCTLFLEKVAPPSMCLRSKQQRMDQQPPLSEARTDSDELSHCKSTTSLSPLRLSTSFSNDDDDDPLYIEVAPGYEVKLRGSTETQRAIDNWNIVCISCIDCTVQLYCIENAEYLLCPLCRCVSPLSLIGSVSPSAHGVGVGFQSCRTRRRPAAPAG